MWNSSSVEVSSVHLINGEVLIITGDTLHIINEKEDWNAGVSDIKNKVENYVKPYQKNKRSH